MKTHIKNLFIAFGLAAVFFFSQAQATTIFPIATNPGREYGLSFAFDGTNYLVGIWGDEIADTNITAQLVSPTGALVGSRIKVGRTGSIPFVAFDGTNYLLVWRDDINSATYNDDIYGQLISRSGALVGSPFPITTDPGYQAPEAMSPVVFGAGKYLVVWRDESSGRAIYGRLFFTSGAPSSSEIMISAGGLDAPSAAVAFDGTNFLVVWQQQTNASQQQYETYGALITPAGTKGTNIIISQTTSAGYAQLHLLFNGTNYFVTWSKDVGPGSPSPSDFDIYGRFVRPDGSFPGNEIALVTETGDQVAPVLAFDGANYLLSWKEGALGSTNSNVKFQFFSPAGLAIGPPFAPFAAQGTNNPVLAAALFDGTRFAAIATLAGGDPNVKYGTSGDVYGMFIPKSTASPRLNVTGPLVGAQFSLTLTGTPGINYAVQVATNLSSPNWTAVVTNSPTNGTFSFTDTSATNKSRFYRAVKQ